MVVISFEFSEEDVHHYKLLEKFQQMNLSLCSWSGSKWERIKYADKLIIDKGTFIIPYTEPKPAPDFVRFKYGTNIEDVDISIRLYNLLKVNRINTMDELVNVNLKELRKTTRGFGASAELECEELIDEYNRYKNLSS
jgi:hypothetical protein